MVHIKKGREPEALIQDKRNGVKDYDSLSLNAKKAIYKSLLIEQHYLCAYCMRRIDEESIQIEHYIAQHPMESGYDAGLTIDYNNMLGVCPGNKGHRKAELTCDQHRGNETLTIDPLKAESVQAVRYSSDGTIYSKDEKVNHDLNDVLNLNCSKVFFKENRKAALDALKAYLSKEYRGHSLTKAQLTKLFENYNVLDSKGGKKEYIGIINDYLLRKIATA